VPLTVAAAILASSHWQGPAVVPIIPSNNYIGWSKCFKYGANDRRGWRFDRLYFLDTSHHLEAAHRVTVSTQLAGDTRDCRLPRRHKLLGRGDYRLSNVVPGKAQVRKFVRRHIRHQLIVRRQQLLPQRSFYNAPLGDFLAVRTEVGATAGNFGLDDNCATPWAWLALPPEDVGKAEVAAALTVCVDIVAVG